MVEGTGFLLVGQGAGVLLNERRGEVSGLLVMGEWIGEAADGG